ERGRTRTSSVAHLQVSSGCPRFGIVKPVFSCYCGNVPKKAISEAPAFPDAPVANTCHFTYYAGARPEIRDSALKLSTAVGCVGGFTSTCTVPTLVVNVISLLKVNM